MNKPLPVDPHPINPNDGWTPPPGIELHYAILEGMRLDRELQAQIKRIRRIEGGN